MRVGMQLVGGLVVMVPRTGTTEQCSWVVYRVHQALLGASGLARTGLRAEEACHALGQKFPVLSGKASGPVAQSKALVHIMFCEVMAGLPQS
jgi:hypothetical protein